MSFKRILRRIILGLLLGGRSLFGISMSSEKIEELLYSNNQPSAEDAPSDNEGERANRNNGSAKERLKCAVYEVLFHCGSKRKKCMAGRRESGNTACALTSAYLLRKAWRATAIWLGSVRG